MKMRKSQRDRGIEGLGALVPRSPGALSPFR